MFKPLGAMVLVSLVLTACGGAQGGSPLREGRTAYGNTCSACHGDAGQGGVGPDLSGVAATFPSCADQIEWITLGSDRWKEEHGATYGALNAPIAGGMPSHGETLTPNEIATVAAFERSTYGGVDEQDAIEDCGVEPLDE
jgi:mono/diheme cytochrome c family protein